MSAKILRYLKPDTKYILLPYSPHAESGTLTNAAHLIETFLSKYNIIVTLLPLHDNSKILDTICSHISKKKFDTLLTLEGCSSEEVGSKIAEECKMKKIFYFASEISIVKNGGSAGFVAEPSKIGHHIYMYIRHIITEKKKIKDLPILFLKNSGRKIIVNQEAIDNGLIKLSFEKEYFLRHGELVGEEVLSYESNKT